MSENKKTRSYVVLLGFYYLNFGLKCIFTVYLLKLFFKTKPVLESISISVDSWTGNLWNVVANSLFAFGVLLLPASLCFSVIAGRNWEMKHYRLLFDLVLVLVLIVAFEESWHQELANICLYGLCRFILNKISYKKLLAFIDTYYKPASNTEETFLNNLLAKNSNFEVLSSVENREVENSYPMPSEVEVTSDNIDRHFITEEYYVCRLRYSWFEARLYNLQTSLLEGRLGTASLGKAAVAQEEEKA